MYRSIVETLSRRATDCCIMINRVTTTAAPTAGYKLSVDADDRQTDLDIDIA